MSQDRDRRERSQLQHEAEHSRPKRRSSPVLGYLTILFAAAFLLLLLSYFMQQRNAEETINGLTNSVNNMQSVENLVQTNQRLQKENQELEDKADHLTDEVAALDAQQKKLQTDNAKQEQQLQAMDWFWRIQRAYSRGSRSEAKQLAEEFEASGLPSSLPQTSTAVADGPSPAEQYAALLSALGMKQTQP